MAAPVLLLTGTGGFLGQRLLPDLAKHWRVVAASRNAMGPDAVGRDLADPGSLARAFEMAGPNAVVHAGVSPNRMRTSASPSPLCASMSRRSRSWPGFARKPRPDIRRAQHRRGLSITPEA